MKLHHKDEYQGKATEQKIPFLHNCTLYYFLQTLVLYDKAHQKKKLKQ